MRAIALAFTLLLSCGLAYAKIPDGWPFLDYNEAVITAKRLNKPMFVYFGFPTCPYCLYLNQHTFASESLRKLYSDHYVLAYFDIRGNPDDLMTLPGGETMARAEAIKRLKGSPVPAWMFVDVEGKEILMRRSSRATSNAFRLFDLYVTSGEYKQATYEEFLARRGLRTDRAE